MEKKKTGTLDTKSIVTIGLLMALEVVLSRFLSFSAWNMKLGFAFVPVAMAAIMYGPLAGALVGGLGDFIGAVLFPIGAYFPGFTATAALMGAVLGWFLYSKVSFWRALAAAVVNQFGLGLFVNTLWISVLYGSEYWPLFVTRIAQSAVMTPVELVVILLMSRAMSGYLRKREF